ncbi:hypothetical protein PR003_g33061 [Phytophthora rubi]|uniref:Uncharacterized protein n=1 Tax=Phytophthora rubi TaxID=129364 RepID=A0A6A4ATL3_9STRA|nr:hypothetical protein PR003_g33061 [Phytophthora rubi]
MEDIPDIVKEYEATLALISDDGGSEDDHDLVSVIAHEYTRCEFPSNDDTIATSISDEVPVTSRDANSRGTNSRDHSEDDNASRSVDMDISTTTSPLRDLPLVAPCSLQPAPASCARKGLDAPCDAPHSAARCRAVPTMPWINDSARSAPAACTRCPLRLFNHFPLRQHSPWVNATLRGG